MPLHANAALHLFLHLKAPEFLCLSEVLLNVSPASGAVTVFRLIQTKAEVWPPKEPEVTLKSQDHSRRIHSVFSEEMQVLKTLSRLAGYCEGIRALGVSFVYF